MKFDPDKYRIEWGGQFENQRRAETRLLLIFGLVLGLMVILLYSGFGVFRQAMLILGIVPLASLLRFMRPVRRSTSRQALALSRCSASPS